MKKIIKQLAVAASFIVSSAMLPTNAMAAPKTIKALPANNVIAINFKVDEKFDVQLHNGKFKGQKVEIRALTDALNNRVFTKEIKRLHAQKSYEAHKEQRQKLLDKGKKLPKLANWYRIEVSSKMDPQEIIDIYNTLAQMPHLSHVEFEAPVVPLYTQCPSLGNCEGPGGPGSGGTTNPDPTPNLVNDQDYLGASPLGIGANFAWTQSGGNGAGVRIIDMENGFNQNHEDLPSTFVRINDSNDSDHGTAVLSVVGALNNGIGVTGIAHGAQLGFYGWGSNTASSIVQAAGRLNAGDVLILEGQIASNLSGTGECTSTNQDGCVPMEWSQANFDAIQTATQNGVIVIEAAGNGDNNLDDNIYLNRFNRNTRDSGAFLIAATNSTANIQRSIFSNHGTRIDFNAWGQNVAAAGLYGNTLFNGGANRTYSDGFAGTSSASPIVAGAVASLQGYAIATMGQALTVEQVRDILTNTGVPEPASQQVGVRPNLAQAIPAASGTLFAPKLTSISEACFGFNTLNWNAVSGATSYKVYINNAYHATTSYTSRSVNVVGFGKTATVKACNSSGCSSMSNKVNLYYLSQCF